MSEAHKRDEIDDITATAQRSVDGFLTNIAKGVRRAMDEGGRGTRRRVETYTSHHNASQSSSEEWDEYDVTIVDGEGPPDVYLAGVGSHPNTDDPVVSEDQQAARRSERLRRVYELSFRIVLLRFSGAATRASTSRCLRRLWPQIQSRHPQLEGCRANFDYLLQKEIAAERPSHKACWVDATEGCASPLSPLIQELIRALPVSTSEAIPSGGVGEYFHQLSQCDSPAACPLSTTALFVGILELAGLHSRIVIADGQDAGDSQLAGDKRDRDGIPMPTSPVWAEVFCPFRQVILSVNPLLGTRPLWNANYVFAFGLGTAVVDVTPRYTSSYHTTIPKRLDAICGSLKHIVWPHVFPNGKDYLAPASSGPLSHLMARNPNPKTRFVLPQFLWWCWKSQRTKKCHHLESTCETAAMKLVTSFSLMQSREAVQISKLVYSADVPTTFKGLKGHSLYVIERDIKRHEGIHPKDKSTIVGTIRGEYIYKRTAVVGLRSADGWLREGRAVRDGEVPYKVAPPPPSRPLSRPSNFYGLWQTTAFKPLPPVGEPGFLALPRHNTTNWYILLGASPPKGIAVVNLPSAAAVCRKSSIDFRLVVLGFRREETHQAASFRSTFGMRYVPIIEGVVVLAEDREKLIRAHKEFEAVRDEQQRRRTALRARNMWLHFCQRLVTTARLSELFKQGN